MTIFDAIFSSSAESVAIIFEGQQITYGELRDVTLRFAHAFEQLNVTTGVRVALLIHDSPEFVASFIALCSSGAIAVPINTGLRLSEHSSIIRNCGAEIALIDEDLWSNFLDAGEVPTHSLRDVVVINRTAKQPRKDDKLRVHSLSQIISEPTAPTFPEPEADQPAFILYTSGSTGEAKGAIHTQSDIFYTNETYCAEVLKIRRDDRVFSSS